MMIVGKWSRIIPFGRCLWRIIHARTRSKFQFAYRHSQKYDHGRDIPVPQPNPLGYHTTNQTLVGEGPGNTADLTESFVVSVQILKILPEILLDHQKSKNIQKKNHSIINYHRYLSRLHYSSQPGGYNIILPKLSLSLLSFSPKQKAQTYIASKPISNSFKPSPIPLRNRSTPTIASYEQLFK